MDARVRTIINLMHLSIPDRVSICAMSKRVNLSASRLRQLFKKETGRSPMRYLINLRMQKAKHLIRNTFLSIKGITFLCGIKDVSHFVRDFKKLYGRTPSEFRVQSQRSLKMPARDGRAGE